MCSVFAGAKASGGILHHQRFRAGALGRLNRVFPLDDSGLWNSHRAGTGSSQSRLAVACRPVAPLLGHRCWTLGQIVKGRGL